MDNRPKHADTYLPDGRFGLDANSPSDCVGFWRLKGHTLTTYWGGVIATNIILSATSTELTVSYRGKKFIARKKSTIGGN
jgi:hypothetical protein